MILTKKPRVWAPQDGSLIDRGSSLASGLAVLTAVRGGRLFEHVAGQRFESNSAGYDITRLGPAADFANQQTAFTHNPSHNVLGSITALVFARVDTLSNYSALISKGVGTTQNLPYEFRIGEGPVDSRLSFTRGNPTGGPTGYRGWFASGGASLINDSELHAVGVTQADNIQTTPTFYLDGKPITAAGSNGTGTGQAGESSGLLYLGKRADGVTYLDGRIMFAAVWARVLSHGEMQALSANPWQLFQPRRIWVPVSVAGGGDINLTVAGSTQAATSSTGAITQAHALTGAGSSQAATSSTGAITQTQVLAGAGSSQAATASTGAITQAHALTGSNSTQAATSSTGTISQIHQLVGASSTQASTSSTGAISLGTGVVTLSAALVTSIRTRRITPRVTITF